jgi:hypothetical protein
MIRYIERFSGTGNMQALYVPRNFDMVLHIEDRIYPLYPESWKDYWHRMTLLRKKVSIWAVETSFDSCSMFIGTLQELLWAADSILQKSKDGAASSAGLLFD